METWIKEELWADLERIGEDKARERLADGDYGIVGANSKRALVEEWLRYKEQVRRPEAALRAAEAATHAAAAAERQAADARQANIKATIALIIAVFSAVAAITSIIVSLMTAP